MEILQEQYCSQFCSPQIYQVYRYASVTFCGIAIINKRLVAAESGSGAVSSWSMPDGNVV